VARGSPAQPGKETVPILDGNILLGAPRAITSARHQSRLVGPLKHVRASIASYEDPSPTAMCPFLAAINIT